MNDPLHPYTIRNVPKDMHYKLKEFAKRKGINLNEAILILLEKGINLNQEMSENHDLDWILGTWVDDKEQNEIFEDLRKIDP